MNLEDFDTSPTPPKPKPPTMRAEHEGNCPGCDFSIAIGDEIAYSEAEHGWVHYPRCWG